MAVFSLRWSLPLLSPHSEATGLQGDRIRDGMDGYGSRHRSGLAPATGTCRPDRFRHEVIDKSGICQDWRKRDISRTMNSPYSKNINFRKLSGTDARLIQPTWNFHRFCRPTTTFGRMGEFCWYGSHKLVMKQNQRDFLHHYTLLFDFIYLKVRYINLLNTCKTCKKSLFYSLTGQTKKKRFTKQSW